jgi:hypothetical protein
LEDEERDGVEEYMTMDITGIVCEDGNWIDMIRDHVH